jgi:hypothetical protein
VILVGQRASVLNINTAYRLDALLEIDHDDLGGRQVYIKASVGDGWLPGTIAKRAPGGRFEVCMASGELQQKQLASQDVRVRVRPGEAVQPTTKAQLRSLFFAFSQDSHLALVAAQVRSHLKCRPGKPFPPVPCAAQSGSKLSSMRTMLLTAKSQAQLQLQSCTSKPVCSCRPGSLHRASLAGQGGAGSAGGGRARRPLAQCRAARWPRWRRQLVPDRLGGSLQRSVSDVPFSGELFSPFAVLTKVHAVHDHARGALCTKLHHELLSAICLRTSCPLHRQCCC